MRYVYVNFTVICTIRSISNISTNFGVAANGSKINFIKLFKDISNAHNDIDFTGNDTEINIIVVTNKGIYNKNISGKKLEKIFKRLTR